MFELRVSVVSRGEGLGVEGEDGQGVVVFAKVVAGDKVS